MSSFLLLLLLLLPLLLRLLLPDAPGWVSSRAPSSPSLSRLFPPVLFQGVSRWLSLNISPGLCTFKFLSFLFFCFFFFFFFPPFFFYLDGAGLCAGFPISSPLLLLLDSAPQTGAVHGPLADRSTQPAAGEEGWRWAGGGVGEEGWEWLRVTTGGAEGQWREAVEMFWAWLGGKVANERV